ncbi:MAG: DUF1643 domain-containing protein [Spirochaetaceae bacterium]|nr:DUF1643 domain-containing protein [Spirochaetaceae bacterium]
MTVRNKLKITKIYLKSQDNKYRYALGTQGGKILYCFGINPSIATPEKDDPTMKKVKSFACKSGFDSVVMLNIYPQRATNPNYLSNKINLKEHKKNLQKIMSIIKNGSTVWVAWGNLINKRSYLKDCLIQIKNKLATKNLNWVKMGELTKRGNPRHPLYLKYQSFSEYIIP